MLLPVQLWGEMPWAEEPGRWSALIAVVQDPSHGGPLTRGWCWGCWPDWYHWNPDTNQPTPHLVPAGGTRGAGMVMDPMSPQTTSPSQESICQEMIGLAEPVGNKLKHSEHPKRKPFSCFLWRIYHLVHITIHDIWDMSLWPITDSIWYINVFMGLWHIASYDGFNLQSRVIKPWEKCLLQAAKH